MKTAPFIIGVILISCLIGLRSNSYSPGKQIVSDTTKPAPIKKYPVLFTLDEWQNRLNWLGYVAQMLKKSDLPSRDVSFINDSLISRLQVEVIGQIQAQLPKDSTKK